jgi:hypothetical protein
MARLLSLPRRLAVVLFTLVLSIAQLVRPKPSDASGRLHRPERVNYGINSALLFRLASPRAGASGFFQRHFALEATGIFPYVRLVPLSAGSPVPVPMLLGSGPQASLKTSETGLLHATIRGLSKQHKESPGPKADPEGSCGSCSTCSGCSTCSTCSTCAGCSSCSTSCGSNCGTDCGTSCGGSCGFTSCGGNCLSCASCGSCASCTSCVCGSCSSCASCGSCTSCVG